MKATDLYIEFARETTDAPALYAQWLAYLVVSCVLHKSVWMEYGFKRVYPNIYLLIIGPSSTYRKSHSQDLAAWVVRQIYPDFELIDTSSRESFISEMAREDRVPSGSGLVLIDELAGWMARAKTSPHFSGMIQDLSSAFTGRSIARRVGVSEKEKQIYRIDEPFLNISAACSYDWLTKAVETSDVTGGFLARFMWIIAPEKNGVHWSEPKSGDIFKFNAIVENLRKIKDSLIGRMDWSPPAKEYWDWWYSDFRTRNTGGQWDANFERMTMQVRKIAMINAAQEMRLIISREDIEEAVIMAEPLVDNLNEVAIGENPEQIWRQRIFQFMKKRVPDPVTTSDLLNGIGGLDKRRLEISMETLTEADQVIKYIKKSENPLGGRPATYYRLADVLGAF